MKKHNKNRHKQLPAVLAAEVAAGRLGALEVFAGAETTRRVGVEEVADAGRAVEVLAAGLAGDEVFDGDAADVPFTADVALFGGAAVTVRVVVVVVVVVVFLTVDVAAETIGLVAGLVVAGAAFGAVLVCLEGVVEDGAAGVAFLNGDSLVGRAGLAASADEVLASVVATRLWNKKCQHLHSLDSDNVIYVDIPRSRFRFLGRFLRSWFGSWTGGQFRSGC